MTDVQFLKPLRYRSIFISDTHLGFRGARAEELLEFLRSVECDTLYLVGDIIDIWEMRRRGLHWPDSHNAVIQDVLARARAGTKVVYIPGNHDELMREYAGMNIEGVSIELRHIHTCADGKRLLILHGDEFDTVVQCSPFIAMLGGRMYGWLIRANHWTNRVRQALGRPYWSLAAHLKHRVKNAMQYIANYEQALIREARESEVDGLVCGHIHHAELREVEGIQYCNDGDWVESCTALVESHTGELELLRWNEIRDGVINGAGERSMNRAA